MCLTLGDEYLRRYTRFIAAVKAGLYCEWNPALDLL